MKWVLTAAVMAALLVQPRRTASAQEVYEYSVATLAPPDVTVPPIVLENEALHALLVELAGGASTARMGERLGISADELEALYRLIEIEGLGRQTAGGGWVPLALALDARGVERLAEVVSPLVPVIADTLQARWTAIDSMVSDLPVAGRLPLEQTGFVLVGDYLLGLFQHEALWLAGLGPQHRRYAYRVYRMDPRNAPAGHQVNVLGDSGWQIVSYSPSRAAFGFASLLDPGSPVCRALLEEPDRQELQRLAVDIVNSYRRWYLLGSGADAPTRRILESLEAVDREGRLCVPIISQEDLTAMRSIALWIGEALWPHLIDLLPQIGAVAGELGYGAPEMLGEVTLAAWEMASDRAIRLLAERGVVLAPDTYRGQALLVAPRR